MSQSESIPSGLYIATPLTATARVPVLSHPTSNVKIMAQLPAGCPIEVLGQEGAWLRIRLPDGQKGYIASASASPRGSMSAQVGATIAATPTRQPPVYPIGSQPRVEVLTTPKAIGAKMVGVSILAGLSVLGLMIGFVLSSIVLENCTVNFNGFSASQGCQVVSYPYATPGYLLMALGGIGFVAAIIIAIRLRSKRR